VNRRWFDGTILVVSLFLIAVGGLAKPWATKKMNQGADGVTGTVAETVSVLA
jgi:hypothetical protein